MLVNGPLAFEKVSNRGRYLSHTRREIDMMIPTTPTISTSFYENASTFNPSHSRFSLGRRADPVPGRLSIQRYDDRSTSEME